MLEKTHNDQPKVVIWVAHGISYGGALRLLLNYLNALIKNSPRMELTVIFSPHSELLKFTRILDPRIKILTSFDHVQQPMIGSNIAEEEFCRYHAKYLNATITGKVNDRLFSRTARMYDRGTYLVNNYAKFPAGHFKITINYSAKSWSFNSAVAHLHVCQWQGNQLVDITDPLPLTMTRGIKSKSV